MRLGSCKEAIVRVKLGLLVTGVGIFVMNASPTLAGATELSFDESMYFDNERCDCIDPTGYRFGLAADTYGQNGGPTTLSVIHEGVSARFKRTDRGLRDWLLFPNSPRRKEVIKALRAEFYATGTMRYRLRLVRGSKRKSRWFTLDRLNWMTGPE
jgi:hypothetical protein